MLGKSMQRAKEPVDTTADKWPADIGEQMAWVHRIYPIVDTASDAPLVDLLKLVEDLRAGQGESCPNTDRERLAPPCPPPICGRMGAL